MNTSTIELEAVDAGACVATGIHEVTRDLATRSSRDNPDMIAVSSNVDTLSDTNVTSVRAIDSYIQDTPARQSYPDSLKLEAVLAVIEGGMSKREAAETYKIASTSTLQKWLTAYRKQGKGALVAKKRGRPVGRRAVRHLGFDSLNYQASYYLHAENARLVGKLGGR